MKFDLVDGVPEGDDAFPIHHIVDYGAKGREVSLLFVEKRTE